MNARKRKKSERGMIESFARMIRRAGARPAGVVVGVGDDAAVVRANEREDYVITQDIMVEGRHYKRSWLSGREIGWRLAAINLSDIAAMGGRPKFALMSLVIPKRFPQETVEAVEREAIIHLAEHGAALVGGNVSAGDGAFSCDLTLLGTVPRGKAWRRRGRAGDAIVVVGQLGEAAAGVALLDARGRKRRKTGRLVTAYKKPRPLLRAAEIARRSDAVHGAIDVSDGFSTDLLHMCEAGGVGCEVDAFSLPVSKALSEFAGGRGINLTRWLMGAGESYALILSVAPSEAEALCKRIDRKLGVSARAVGHFTRGKGQYRIIEDGRARPLKPIGWDHLGSR